MSYFQTQDRGNILKYGSQVSTRAARDNWKIKIISYFELSGLQIRGENFYLSLTLKHG